MCGVGGTRKALGEKGDRVGDTRWFDDRRRRGKSDAGDCEDEPVEIVCPEPNNACVRVCFDQRVFGPTQHVFEFGVWGTDSD